MINTGPLAKSTVVADQTVNPNVLGSMSTARGTPGADMLHEVTEAYQGALISQSSGVSSPASNASGSVYPTAHGRATAQSGTVNETLYNATGGVMNMLPSGGYSPGVTRVEWSVTDRSGARRIIQTLP